MFRLHDFAMLLWLTDRLACGVNINSINGNRAIPIILQLWIFAAFLFRLRAAA